MIYTPQDLKRYLDKLLSNDSLKNIDLGYIPPIIIEEMLSKIEDIDLSQWQDFDTNGWELDFCFSFSYKNNPLIFSGSWYYGTYIISKGN